MSRWTLLEGETKGLLLGLVRGQPRTVNDLADALGISNNAVRAHLAGLERDRLVRPGGRQPSTGGKPARLYELTPEAEELFPKAYAPVLAELLKVLGEKRGELEVEELLRQVGGRLGARSGANGAGASEAARVRAAAELLESLGGSVEVTETEGGWRLRSAGCPLSGVVAEVPDACTLAEALVAEVTGRPVSEVCEKGERPRCAFEVRGAETPDS